MLTSLLQLQLNLQQEAVDQSAPYAVGGFELFLSRMLIGLMTTAAVLVFIFLVWGAFDWINSGGEKGKIESGRNKITGAIMGILVLAVVLVIFMFVQSILGIQVIDFTPGPAAPRPGFTAITQD